MPSSTLSSRGKSMSQRRALIRTSSVAAARIDLILAGPLIRPLSIAPAQFNRTAGAQCPTRSPPDDGYPHGIATRRFSLPHVDRDIEWIRGAGEGFLLVARQISRLIGGPSQAGHPAKDRAPPGSPYCTVG